MIAKINGLELDFPFELYQLQKDYIAQLIQALDTKSNAVLESPTGS